MRGSGTRATSRIATNDCRATDEPCTLCTAISSEIRSQCHSILFRAAAFMLKHNKNIYYLRSISHQHRVLISPAVFIFFIIIIQSVWICRWIYLACTRPNAQRAFMCRRAAYSRGCLPVQVNFGSSAPSAPPQSHRSLSHSHAHMQAGGGGGGCNARGSWSAAATEKIKLGVLLLNWIELSERACFSAFASSLVDMQSVAQTSRVNVRMGKLRIENDIDTVTLLAQIDKINNNVDAKRKQFFAYLWKCIPDGKCYLIFGSYVVFIVLCANEIESG